MSNATKTSILATAVAGIAGNATAQENEKC